MEETKLVMGVINGLFLCLSLLRHEALGPISASTLPAVSRSVRSRLPQELSEAEGKASLLPG